MTGVIRNRKRGRRSNREPFPFKKRVRGAQLFFLLLFCAIFLRLVFLQVKSAPSLQERARAHQFTAPRSVPAPRGTIYDRHGKPLALSLPAWDLFAEPPRLRQEPAEIAQKIAPILKRDPALITELLSTSRNFVWLARPINYQQYETIKNLNIPGIDTREKFTRHYPEQATTAHITGITNIDQQGLEGVEREYDYLLAGQTGKLTFLRDGRLNPLPNFQRGEAVKPGQDIYLTLDLRIQRILEEELAVMHHKYRALSTTGIILDAKNGEILALVNHPAYDPNNPGDYPVAHRRNRAVTDPVEPGSVFKTVTAAAALEEGVVSPEAKIFCENGRYLTRGRIVRDINPYQELSFQEVMAKSSNIGTVKVALELGERNLYRYAARFGFGRKTGVDLPGEAPGTLRPPGRWSGLSITAVPIGYEIAATPLQLAASLAAVVNEGLLVPPRILHSIGDDRGNRQPVAEKPARRVISEETAATLTRILTAVTRPGGTAIQAAIPGYHTGGKTGTAQKVVGGEYSHTQHRSSFAGFIKTREQTLVIFILVDEPTGAYYGGEVIGPAFRRAGQRIMLTQGIPPEEDNPETDF